MTLYHIYNPDTFDVTHAIMADTPPPYSTTSKSENYKKPKYNPQDDTIYEAVTEQELIDLEIERQKELKQQQYLELLDTDWYVVRFIETGKPIPEDIVLIRSEIRARYDIILNKNQVKSKL